VHGLFLVHGQAALCLLELVLWSLVDRSAFARTKCSCDGVAVCGVVRQVVCGLYVKSCFSSPSTGMRWEQVWAAVLFVEGPQVATVFGLGELVH